MSEDIEVKVTLKDTNVQASTIARWILQHSTVVTSTQAYYIANCLLKGETWRPLLSTLKDGYDQLIVLDFQVDEPPKPLPSSTDESHFTDASNVLLIERGANSDADAAIEYCRRILARWNNGV